MGALQFKAREKGSKQRRWLSQEYALDLESRNNRSRNRYKEKNTKSYQLFPHVFFAHQYVSDGIFFPLRGWTIYYLHLIFLAARPLLRRTRSPFQRSSHESLLQAYPWMFPGPSRFLLWQDPNPGVPERLFSPSP